MKTAMKKLALYLLALALLLGLLPANAAAAEHPDMPTGWSADAVRTAVEAGLLRGDPSNLLRPTAPITRAELATMLSRVFGGGTPGDVSGFSDLSPGQWHYEAFRSAVGMGLLNGYPDGTMRPEKTLTRAELFAVMARALGLPDRDPAELSAFADAAGVPDWAAGPAAALVHAGYIHGTGTGLAPGSFVTREQFCQVIYNLFDVFITEPGVYSDLTGAVLVCADGVELRDARLDGLSVAGAVTRNVTLVNCECARYLSRSAAAAGEAQTPPEPEAGLEEAYAQFLLDKAGGFRFTFDEIVPGVLLHGDYEVADGVAHAWIERDEYGAQEYCALLDETGSDYDDLLIRKVGTWCKTTTMEKTVSGFSLPFLPESLDAAHFADLGDGLYRVLEEYRDEEGFRFMRYSASNYYINDLQVQVRGGTIESIQYAYTAVYGSVEFTTQRRYEFADFAQVELSRPEAADRLNAEDIYYMYYFLDEDFEEEDIVGLTGLLEGTVCATMDHCVIVRDDSGCMIPVYAGEGVGMPKLWDDITAIGVTEIDQFLTTASVRLNDPEKLEISEGEPETRLKCSDFMMADTAYFDVVDFLRVQVPAIPEDSELEQDRYLLDVTDENGNELAILLGDVDSREQNPTGTAARFRAALRAFVNARLEASGEETCAIDFSAILMDLGLLIPVHETTFAEAAPPAMVFSPEERTVVAGTPLTQALSGVRLVREDDYFDEGTAVLDLDYDSDYNPLVPGDYEVTVYEQGRSLTMPVHVVQPENAVFHASLDLDSLKDLDKDDFIAPSLPSEGDVDILVIPIRFTDSPGYDADLETAFNGADGATGWYSLREYYEKVSYGKLRLNATILAPYESGVAIGDVESEDGRTGQDPILRAALAHYDDAIDYSRYDNNGDGDIDCVYFVFDAPTYRTDESSQWWAFNAWYTPQAEGDGVFDGLRFNQYLWMGADWFNGNFHDNSPGETAGATLNCRTLIHETGHALGLTDYYGRYHNAAGDSMMMSSGAGDHDPFSKLLLNWIDPAFDYAEPKTLKLRSFPETGDALVVSGDGAETTFTQFYTVSLYTPEGVNEAFKDDGTGLFTRPGVVIYYVNAQLKPFSQMPSGYFHATNNMRDFDSALIRLVQNNGRSTLRSLWIIDPETGEYSPSVATDEDLFQPGDACFFTWPEDGTLPCIGFRVDEIDRDEEGWYAIVTVG